MAKYFSVVVPYASENATIWHPIDATGPFSLITRGCFKTAIQAEVWAADNIPGHKYEIKEYDSAWLSEVK